MITPLFSALLFFLGVALAWPPQFWMGVVLLLLLLLRWWRATLLGGAFVLGLWRVHFYESQIPVAPVGEDVELSGPIVAEIDRRQDHQKITVLTDYGRVLVKLPPYEDFEFGDWVEISGLLEAPSQDIEGFNYAHYLARYRVWWVMNRAHVMVVERGPPSVRRTLYQFKSRLETRLNELYMEPEASFVAGLLLGSRKGMPEDLALAFQQVGLTHIVAISGYNISLVIAGTFLFFSFLPLKWRVWVSSGAILLFVVLVGGSAAVVRAGIMGSLTLWALFTGRKSQVFFALLWSAVIMVAANPYVLLYDVGFQLSFASTLGLLLFVPMLERLCPKWEKGKVLKEAFLLTVAAQITTTPLMLFHFGRISWISPLANVLVAPFLAPAMMFGALSLFFGPPVAMMAWVHLRAVELIALWVATIPWIELPLSVSFGGFVALNLLLAWISLRFYKHEWVRAFVRGGALKSLWASCPGWKRRAK